MEYDKTIVAHKKELAWLRRWQAELGGELDPDDFDYPITVYLPRPR